MPKRIDRIDYVHDAICGKCERILTSGTAYIVINEEGNEIPHGKKCATDVAGKPSSPVPNFTKASIVVPGDGGEGGGGGIRKPTSDAQRYAQAVEYIRLRIEGLEGFKVAPPAKAVDIYNELKADGFDLDKVDTGKLNYLWNLMEKCRKEVPKLSPQYLQACYAFNYWLEKGAAKIAKEEGREFCRSVQAYLQDKRYLSEAQISGANKWFQFLDGIPELKSDVFSRLKQ